MNITRVSIRNIVLRQRNRITRDILSATNEEDLVRIQVKLDAVTPLWEALGYSSVLEQLSGHLQSRAVAVLLGEEDFYSLYQPGKGLWESTRRTIQSLKDLVSN